MKRKHIDVNDYAAEILRALRPGILLTTKAEGKVNSMVIGWGTIGMNWGRPVFAVYVREGRYTRTLLDQNPEFTINAPFFPIGEKEREILKICGSKSGRNMDKIAELGLTPVEGEKISVPGILEFPLTLECKVLYRQKQEYELYPESVRPSYPQDVDSSFPMANKDVHVTYFGEIVDAYLLMDPKLEAADAITQKLCSVDPEKRIAALLEIEKQI